MFAKLRCGGIVSICLCGAIVAKAARPLVVDDADPVGFDNLQFELGSSYRRMEGCNHWDFPFGVAYGVHERVELNIGMGGILDERMEMMADGSSKNCRKRVHGLGDLTTGGKWLLVEEDPFNFRHTVAPEIKFPTANHKKELGSGQTDYDLMWIVSRDLGERCGLHLNGGYTFVGGEADVWHYGVAVDYQLSDRVQAVAEIYNEHDTHSANDPLWQYAVGLRWEVVDGVTLDCAAGTKITPDAPDFMGMVGVTVVF